MVVPAAGGHPAQAVELLDDQHLCAQASGGKGCANAGRSAADHQHIDFICYGDIGIDFGDCLHGD